MAKAEPEGYVNCNNCGTETPESDPSIKVVVWRGEAIPLCPECGEHAEFSAGEGDEEDEDEDEDDEDEADAASC